MRIRPDFLRSLRRTVDLARLEESRHTIFGLTPELRLAYFNPAWLEFAATNGAPRLASDCALGHAVMSAVPAPLKKFYLDGYASALSTGRCWLSGYQAPTPRRMQSWLQRVEPLASSDGLLVTHMLVSDLPHQVAGHAPDPRRYRHPDGRLRQCATCRAFSPSGQPSEWELVPSWLALPPPRVSVELCFRCAEQAYGQRLAA